VGRLLPFNLSIDLSLRFDTVEIRNGVFMAKKIRIIVNEDKFNRMLIELNSSGEQLLDCDENDWSEEVAELEDYFRNLDREEIM